MRKNQWGNFLRNASCYRGNWHFTGNFPYIPAIVSDGEISSEMPVPTEETGISQHRKFPLYIYTASKVKVF